MQLERLIFKNDKGEFVDIPASEVESLYVELGKVLDGLAEKKAKENPGGINLLEQMEKARAERIEEATEREKARNIPMPSNWPLLRPWPFDPSHPYPEFLRVTCEQQPLRFEWDGIEGDKVRLRATQQYRFTTSASA